MLEVYVLDSQEMKEHMALVRLYKDGFVKGGPDEFEIELDAGHVAEKYGASAKLFFGTLVRLLDGLKKSGFSVQTKTYKSKFKMKIGLPYVSYEDGPLADAMSYDVEDLLEKGIRNKPTIYICEKVKTEKE